MVVHLIAYSHVVFVSPPGEFITVLGGTATYACTISGVIDGFIESTQWLANDIALEEMETVALIGTQLRFSMLSVEYNNTSIRCRATLTSGSVSTSEAVLLHMYS